MNIKRKWAELLISEFPLVFDQRVFEIFLCDAFNLEKKKFNFDFHEIWWRNGDGAGYRVMVALMALLGNRKRKWLFEIWKNYRGDAGYRSGYGFGVGDCVAGIDGVAGGGWWWW